MLPEGPAFPPIGNEPISTDGGDDDGEESTSCTDSELPAATGDYSAYNDDYDPSSKVFQDPYSKEPPYTPPSPPVSIPPGTDEPGTPPVSAPEPPSESGGGGGSDCNYLSTRDMWTLRNIFRRMMKESPCAGP